MYLTCLKNSSSPMDCGFIQAFPQKHTGLRDVKDEQRKLSNKWEKSLISEVTPLKKFWDSRN